jgi:hypothetical protein
MEFEAYLEIDLQVEQAVQVLAMPFELADAILALEDWI